MTAHWWIRISRDSVPVETVLSGPAASISGAAHLAGCKDALISDIGGTTTDITVMVGGLPKLSSKGATIGGRATMVEAADIRTVGLGGDSEVKLIDRGLPWRGDSWPQTLSADLLSCDDQS